MGSSSDGVGRLVLSWRTAWNSAARASRSRNVRIPLTGLTLAAVCLAGFTTA